MNPSSDERIQLQNWLEESRHNFLSAIDALSGDQWRWKPSPDRWSICETAEHIVVSEATLFGRMQHALSSPEDSDAAQKTRGKTALIERVMAPRLHKARAPGFLVPAGRMTAAEARTAFQAQRVEIVRFAAETGADLSRYTAEHPFPVFGTLNAYQWLIYIPLHTMRHVKQIVEVKSTDGYPGPGTAGD